jgi:GNAT superfamily N-acetyltransferase
LTSHAERPTVITGKEVYTSDDDEKEDAMQVELRAATPGDVDAIAELWRAGWLDAHDGRVPDALLEHRSLNSLRKQVPVRLNTTTVAISDGCLAGFVMTHDDEIEQLYVEGAFRGTGVARCLLRHGEQEISERFSMAWLAVVAGNHRARRFYERSGWHDGGPFETLAWTTRGTETIAVPVRRYEKDVARPDNAAPAVAGEQRA